MRGLSRLKSIWRPPPPFRLGPLMQGRLVVLDVGARGGPDQRWRAFGEDVEIIGLEPDARECARLERQASGAARRYLARAAGAQREKRVLHRCKNPGCSSTYLPNRSFFEEFPRELTEMFDVVGESEVEVEPLDEICREHSIAPDVLKLDIQGAELAALAGATGLLERVKLVEVEVEFNSQYREQPLFGDVDRALRAMGFELLGLRRSFWRRRAPQTVAGGQLIHGDALYYHRALLEHQLGERAELVRWLAALSAYQQHDFVEYLLDERASALSALELDSLRKRLIPELSPVWAKLSRSLRRMHDFHHLTLRSWVVAFRNKPAFDWHDPDFF